MVHTETVTLAQIVVLQVPSPLTKYIVVVVGETVNEVPFPVEDPPQFSGYQVHCELYPKTPPDNVREEVVPELIRTGEALAATGAIELI